MPTKFTALVCMIAAAAIATSADAGSTLAKQRVAIQHIGSSFVLTPLTPGAVKPDTGPYQLLLLDRTPDDARRGSDRDQRSPDDAHREAWNPGGP
jgi:hypothetical protein